MTRTLAVTATLLAAGCLTAEEKPGRLAILQDSFQGAVWETAGQVLAGALQRDGWEARAIEGSAVCSPSVLPPPDIALLIVPDARSYPRDGAKALAEYLRHGGRVLFLGAPPLENPVARIAGQWLDRAGYERRVAEVRPDNVLAAATRQIAWQLSARNKDCGATFAPAADGGDAALRYEVKKLDGWAVYRSPKLPGMFRAKHNLLCLRVKGDAATPALVVELMERDGARWMASVPLTAEWEWRVLPVDSFQYWPDSPAGASRGGAGDRCRPGEVTQMAVGLMESRDGVRGGPNGFRVAALGTARNPLDPFPQDESPLVIEGASPSYKLYPCRDIAAWRPAAAPGIRPCGIDLGPVPEGELWSPLPRPGVEGVGRKRKWRLLPVVETLDGDGVCRGSAAWITAQLEGDLRGSLAGCVGAANPEFFASPSGIALVREMVRRMSLPCLLAEGGADRFRCDAASAVRVGACVLSCGTWTGKATVRVTVLCGNTVRFEKRAELVLAPGVPQEISHDLPADTLLPGTLRVRVELEAAGHAGIIDALEHELRIESPLPPARPEEFVQVRDGEFVVGGRIWRINGVNYWPRWVSGMEPADFQQSWLGDAFYDPRLVEADLALMTELGINLVSVQLGNPSEAGNLRDFLRRCRARGIRVNGFLHGASPLAFDEPVVRALIDTAGLREEPALFAYDVIWEPGNHLFNEQGRKRWAADWARWVAERYGSPEAAERDWGFANPRERERIAAPTDRQMREDGPWRVMVAAYRRFMDDFTSRKWNDAVRRLREIDPHHLIGFRQGNTLPQDFALTGPVKHIDFISPEGYAITDLETGEDVAGFITRYVKLTSGGKPVYWSEFGRSVWDRERMRVDPDLVAAQGRYNAMFHRMAAWSGAQGVAPWWWPGGYRVNERSDYGILDPGGSPRPSARLLLEHGPALRSPPQEALPLEWLIVDRDAHPGGYWHLAFQEGWQACRRARLAGRRLSVRTQGTGTNSANTPLVAVGNVPCHGSNPPKYLNAEFNWLRIQAGDGRWQEVPFGATPQVSVNSGKPVRIRASVGNLGEASWLPPQPGIETGAVFLTAGGDGPDFQRAVSAPVPFLGDADFGEFEIPPDAIGPRTLVFEMTALKRCRFGEKRTVKLTTCRTP